MSARRGRMKKRILQYAQGRFHTQRIGLMVSLTRSMELVVTASETEALLLESNFIKKLKPRFNVVLRDDKSFAELMIRTRPPRAPGAQASRGPHHARRLFRPLRLDLGGQPDPDHPAEGLPAALLLGQRLRDPHPALHAAPDQALLGALHRPDLAGGLRRTGRRGLGLPEGQVARRHRPPVRGDEAAVRRHGLRTGRPRPRPHPRPVGHLDGELRQRRRRGRGRRLRPVQPRAARPACRCSSIAAARTGAAAPISRASTGPTPIPKSSPPSSASSTRTSRSRA